MPLKGEESVKFGIDYEDLWTVRQLCLLLEGNIEYIRLSPPGADGKGVEFELKHREGHVEFHQVKRQSTRPWSISHLAAPKLPGKNSILQDFEEMLNRDKNHHCHFVSSDRAGVLNELADHARNADDFAQFYQQRLIAENPNRKKDISDLQEEFHRFVKALHQAPAELNEEGKKAYAYSLLKRIHVATISESLLEQFVELQIRTLIDNPHPNTVRACLADIVKKNTSRTRMTAPKLWDDLKNNHNLRARDFAQDPYIPAQIAKQNDLTLKSLDYRINQTSYPPPQLAELMEALDSSHPSRLIFLTGSGGLGKSELLGQALKELQTKSVPVLALRLPRTQELRINQPHELGELFGFTDAPGIVLSRYAGGPCVLMIDQLDAISQTSGRNQDVFASLAIPISLLLGDKKPIKFLLVCRSEDIKQDERIKKLISDFPQQFTKEIKLNPLPKSLVLQAIQEAKAPTEHYSEQQLNLLTKPLVLKLLVQQLLVEPTYRFKLVDNLIQQYLLHVEDRLTQAKKSGSIKVLHRIIELMIQQRRREIPASYILEDHDVLQQITSEGLIEFSQAGTVSFLQDSFYDYLFAHYFCERADRNLLTYLRANGQHLPDRALVAQVLSMRRQQGGTAYFEELNFLLLEDEICFFLKDRAFDLLKSVDHVLPEEWEILREVPTKARQCTDPLLSQYYLGRFWQTIMTETVWFEYLYSLGVLQYWLYDPDPDWVSRTLWLLNRMYPHHPQQILKLFRNFYQLARSQEALISDFFRGLDCSVSEESLEMLIELIQAGLMDAYNGKSTQAFWHAIYELPQKNPAYAIRALDTYLRHQWEESKKHGQPDPFAEGLPLSKETGHQDKFEQLAEAAPLDYFLTMSSFLLEVLKAFGSDAKVPQWNQASYVRHIGRMDYYSKWIDTLYVTLRTALHHIVRDQSPASLRSTLNRLEAQQTDFFDMMLLPAYASRPQTFCKRAAKLVLVVLQRWQMRKNSSGVRACASVIRQISPCLSRKDHTALESGIIAFQPDKYSAPRNLKRKLTSQEQKQMLQLQHKYNYLLLKEINPDRLSAKGLKTRQEFDSLFEDADPIILEGTVTWGAAVSPIPREELEKFSDADWIAAISEHHQDTLETLPSSKHWGGADELAHMLKQFALVEPERFSHILLQLPLEVKPIYFYQGLDALEDSLTDNNILMQVCERVLLLPENPLAFRVCMLISSLAGKFHLSEAWLNKLCDFALSEITTKNRFLHMMEDDTYLQLSMNTLQGRALEAIGHVLYAQPESLSVIFPCLEQLSESSSAQTWAILAYPIGIISERKRALELFLKIQHVDDDGVLASYHVYRVLNHFRHRSWDSIYVLVQRMVHSANEKNQFSGTMLFTTQAIWYGSAKEDFDSFWPEANLDQRKGLAEAAGWLVCHPHCLAQASRILASLFHDVPEVVKSASKCFRRLKQYSEENALPLEVYRPLLKAFAASPALQEHDSVSPLVYFLKDRFDCPSDVLCSLAEAFLPFADQNGQYHNVEMLQEIIIRTYEQTYFEDIKLRCLRIIDSLLLIDHYRFHKGLKSYDTDLQLQETSVG